MAATYVLVHGAFNGGWCWKRVAPLLRAGGYEVYAPTLTGLGERVHLAGPEVGLETHTLAVVTLLEYEDLERVVLVGHSFGGMVITAVAERAPERLSHLVYLDAAVPADGESRWDSLDPARRAAFEERVRTAGEGWRIPPPSQIQLPSEEDARWVASKLTPQPLRTYRDRVSVRNPAAAALPKTYVRCTEGVLAPTLAADAARARAAGWAYRELVTDHLCYATAPADVAEILLSVG